MPDIATHLLSNHYNRTRSDYCRQLARSSLSGGDVLPFLGHAARGLADGLQEQLDLVRDHQLAVVFREHVRDTLATDISPMRAGRQEVLVAALAEKWPDAVERGDVRYLTPQLAKMYGDATAKTVTRDLGVLAERKLVTREGRTRIKANVDALRAFLPLQLQAHDAWARTLSVP